MTFLRHLADSSSRLSVKRLEGKGPCLLLTSWVGLASFLPLKEIPGAVPIHSESDLALSDRSF